MVETTKNMEIIQKQIEYYFSDANFPKDKFLMAECAKTEEGWVDLATIGGFNRMTQLLPSEADRIAAIASAPASRILQNLKLHF